jgi:hypothetical protein
MHSALKLAIVVGFLAATPAPSATLLSQSTVTDGAGDTCSALCLVLNESSVTFGDIQIFSSNAQFGWLRPLDALSVNAGVWILTNDAQNWLELAGCGSFDGPCNPAVIDDFDFGVTVHPAAYLDLFFFGGTLPTPLDGSTIVDSDRFVWDQSSDQYIFAAASPNYQIDVNAATVPEPTTTATFGVGLAILFVMRQGCGKKALMLRGAQCAL